MASQWKREGINERLKQFVENLEYSFADIAAALNSEFQTTLSRCAVMGRAHRLKLKVSPAKRHIMIRLGADRSLATKIAKYGIAPRGQRPVNAIPKGRGAQGGSRAMRIVERKKTLTELFGVLNDGLRDLPPDVSSVARLLLDLIDDTSQCRWPVTTPEGEPQLFCADVVVPQRPYCLRHCHRAYEAPRNNMERMARRVA